MRILKPNWYGLDHSKVSSTFEGNPTFVNDFCVRGEYQPSAVYYCPNPNRRKKHRKFVLLTSSGGQMYIRGMSPREMNKFRYQDAVHCLSCDDVVYSINRHDFRHCSCGNVSIDGGKDYTKISFKSKAKYKMVVLDLLTDLISDPKKR
jgi:hypothetical protein